MGSVCSRRPSKADPRPLWVPGTERRAPPQDLVAIVEAQEQEDILREEARSTSSQVLQLLPAIAWALCGWNILIGFPEAVYWHILNPYSLDTQCPPLFLVGAWVLSLLLLDCLGLQRTVGMHAGTVSVMPPLFYGLSAVPSAQVRSVCLTAAAGALAWSAAAVLGTPLDVPRRQRDGWACLISLCGLLMLRWCCATTDIFLTEPVAKIALGCLGVLSAIMSACEEQSARRANVAPDSEKCVQCTDCRGCLDCGSWPAAAASGLMGGSALVLFQTYLSTLEAPAESALLAPSYLVALWTLSAVGLGVAALAAVYSMVPWWLDTCQAALFIGGLPVVGCGLQWTAGESVGLWGLVQGTGSKAHAGLLALAAAFPFMLALFGKELYLLTRSRAAGRALFVAGAVWLVSFQAHFAVLYGGSAPAWGAELQGRPYKLALLMGAAWGVGVLCAPNGAGRPSVHELWYMSQHSVPKRGEYTNGAAVLLGTLFALFVAVGVPLRVLGASVVPPESDSLLIVAQYNVQQGFDLHGWPNVRCVADALGAAGADLVGLAEASGPRLATANNDAVAAYASRLRMGYFKGAPGALASVDGGILSRLPFDGVSGSALEVLMDCDHCPTQAHLWTRSRVTWKGVQIEFHSVHTEWFADPAPQVQYIAGQIRRRFATGPFILVGTFNMPQRDATRPLDTAMAHLIDGTGLKEAFGALDSNVSLPLQPTEFVSGLHLDYIFYRDLELVGTIIHSDVQCSDHMPLVASFRLSE